VVKDLKIKVGDKVSEGDAIVTLDVADGQEGGDVAANEVSPKSAGKSAPERAEAEVEATEPAKEREKRAPAKAAPVAGPAEGGEIVEVRVPDIGDFTDVDVIEVLVSAGDRVETDDPLITLESDKATMDRPGTRSPRVP
jgi:pyruvate dehydrogenase E2 component (dihydrolipoamide acetyltransferase)